MKQVKSFETLDGKLFTDRVEAETHELGIKIRGHIQTNHKSPIGNTPTFTPTQIGEYVSKHSEEIYELIMKYRRTLQGIKSNQK